MACPWDRLQDERNAKMNAMEQERIAAEKKARAEREVRWLARCLTDLDLRMLCWLCGKFYYYGLIGAFPALQC